MTYFRRRRPDLDPALETIVNRAIEKDPARRYQTMAAMGTHIARLRSRLEPETPAFDADALTRGSSVSFPTRTDRHFAEQRLAERIHRLLATAQQALDGGRYLEALDACEQVVLFSPDDAETTALMERARHALYQQQVEQLIAEARTNIDEGRLAVGAELARRALEIQPHNRAASALWKEVGVIEREERERVVKHRAIAIGIEKCRDAALAGDAEGVVGAAEEVLALDAAHAEARDLLAEARSLVGAREREREAERCALKEIDQIAVGLPRAAIALEERRFANASLDVSAVMGLDADHSRSLGLSGDIAADIEARQQQEEAERRAPEAVRGDRVAGAAGGAQEATRSKMLWRVGGMASLFAALVLVSYVITQRLEESSSPDAPLPPPVTLPTTTIAPSVPTTTVQPASPVAAATVTPTPAAVPGKRAGLQASPAVEGTSAPPQRPSPTQSAPPIPAPPSPAPTTTTVVSTMTTTSTTVPTTTTVAPAASLSESTARPVIDAYYSAYRGRDFGGLLAIYPTATDIDRDRLNALRKDYEPCDYSVTSMDVVTVFAIRAFVTVQVTESCRRRIRASPQLRTGSKTFELGRTPEGRWIVIAGP